MENMKQKTTSSYLTPPSSKFVTLEEIGKAYGELSPKHGGSRESYFGVVYISKKFNIPIDEATSFVNFEGKNYGFDGFYYDPNGKALNLFVFRWSDDHMTFKDAVDKIGNDGMYKVFFSTSKLTDDSQLITSIRSILTDTHFMIERVFINFVFNGDPLNAEQSKVLSFLRENVEDKKNLIDSFFRDRTRAMMATADAGMRYEDQSLELVFQYISNEINLGRMTSSRQTAEYTLGFTDSQKISGGENELTVVFLPLWNLHQMYDEMGERFFEKNIRSGLDDGNMTNYQIKQSLKKIVEGEEIPENFALYHNGIAMTAQSLDSSLDGNHSIRVVEPRILNGVQTIRILKQFVEESKRRNGKEKDSRENLLQKLSSTRVMTRIIRSADEEFLKRVTINNNRQNPIMPWNLRANDLIQIHFEELFGKMGIYYERRENAYKNLTDDDLESIGTEKGVIEIRRFAQTLLAMQGQIDRISEIKEVFENESWYKDTFRERYLQVDSRKLVFLYKVQYRLQSVIREIKNIGIEKYSYAPKAKNLLWCLSIQAIMNDDKFEKHFETYGTSIGIEAGLTQLLKRVASTKLRLILSNSFENRKYRDYMHGGKFSFLRTKAALNDCMKTAAKQFDWETMYL